MGVFMDYKFDLQLLENSVLSVATGTTMQLFVRHQTELETTHNEMENEKGKQGRRKRNQPVLIMSILIKV